MSHYNNVFLVCAKSATEAKQAVEAFLKPFFGKELDSLTFGGRWMWNTEMAEREDEISVESEFNGKKVRVYKDIDGIHLNYEIIRRTDENAEATEIINATHEKFWERLRSALDVRMEAAKSAARGAFLWAEDSIKRKSLTTTPEEYLISVLKSVPDGPEDHMIFYNLEIAATSILKDRWTRRMGFWNITADYYEVDEKKIKAEPTVWWLVNTDLHN